MPVLLVAVALVAARPLAVVPVEGAGMTAAELSQLGPVDDAVRAAAAGRPGLVVQKEAQTQAALSSARAVGVSCAVADVACWRKVAALSEVELVLVPVVAPKSDGALALVLTLVDVAKGGTPARAAAIVPAGPGLAGAVKACVDDVLARSAAPLPDVEVAPLPVPAAPAPPPPSTDRFWVAGAVVAGAVVVGAAAGAAVALALH